MMLWLLLALGTLCQSKQMEVQFVQQIDCCQSSKAVKSLMVPGYVKQTNYDWLVIGKWDSWYGAQDALQYWRYIENTFGTSSEFGSSKDQIQKNLKKKYNDNGKKIIALAYGKDDSPKNTPQKTKQQIQYLANFINRNNLDGVYINYMIEGDVPYSRSEWFSSFEDQLRSKMPGKDVFDFYDLLGVKVNHLTSVQPTEKIQRPRSAVQK